MVGINLVELFFCGVGKSVQEMETYGGIIQWVGTRREGSFVVSLWRLFGLSVWVVALNDFINADISSRFGSPVGVFTWFLYYVLLVYLKKCFSAWYKIH